MQSIRNRYRTSDIHDVMEIVRNPNCEFDPEPSTLPAVGKEHGDVLAIVDKDDHKYTYSQYYEESVKYVRSIK